MSKARILRKQATAATSTKAFRTDDSFQNFMAAVGIGQPLSNQSGAGHYSENYVSRLRSQLEAAYRTSWVCGDLMA